MNAINELIKNFDHPESQKEENHILLALCRLKESELSSEEIIFLEYEKLIFSLQENFNWNNYPHTSWGTYFGPISNVYSSLDQITENVIMHSFNRIDRVNHPMLKARYASIVWDFKAKVQNKEILSTIPDVIIKNCLLAAEIHPFKHSKYVTSKLRYALSVAISLKNETRAQLITNTILTPEAEVCDISILEFMIKNRKKIKLTEENSEKIISALNSIINSRDVRAAKYAALILASYYRDENDEKSTKDIITKYIHNVLNQSSIEHPLRWLTPLEDALKLAEDWGLEESIRKLISNKLSEIGDNMYKDLKVMKNTFVVDFSEFDLLIKNQVPKRNFLDYLANNFISNRKNLENELEQLIANNPLQYSANSSILGSNNLTTAQLNDNKENCLVAHAVKSIAFDGIFLRRFVDLKFNKRTILNKLKDKFFQSSLFPSTHHKQLTIGLDSYIKGNTVPAISILIPQFENAIRILLSKSGHNKLSTKQKGGGLDEQMLGSLLNEEVLKEILGEDLILYFKTIYTHQAGINLRNQVCHGLANDAIFTLQNADRVFHSLLILTQY